MKTNYQILSEKLESIGTAEELAQVVDDACFEIVTNRAEDLPWEMKQRNLISVLKYLRDAFTASAVKD